MMKKSSNGNDKTSFNDGDYPTALVLSILTSLATVPYLLFKMDSTTGGSKSF